MILVDTFVAGRPRTKGSMAKRPNGTLYDSVIGSATWRALVAGAVRDDYAARAIGNRRTPWPAAYAGPVTVLATFYLSVDPVTTRAGDLDKLTRNVLDALGTQSKQPKYNGGVIVDDNLVVDLLIRKVGPSDRPGVKLIVETTG